jgi:integrase
MPQTLDTYLVTLRGRPGFYAQRAVPKALQARLGIKLWRKKAGNSISEARRFLPGFLSWTEEVINHDNPRPKSLSLEEDRLLARGRSIEEINEYWPSIDHEDVEETSKLPPVPLLRTEEIIEKAELLKKPASGTVREWNNCFALFNTFTGYVYPLSATKEDAVRFRDHLLTNYKISSTKKIIRFLSGHWQLHVDEEIIKQNIWKGILKHVKNDERKDKVFDYITTDKKSEMLDPEQKLLYAIIRYSGLRIQEALGLRSCDINLSEKVIEIADNQYRKLGEGIKNASSRRKIPISTKLLSHLSDFVMEGDGLVFGRWLSASGNFNTPSFFHERLGIRPHLMRGHVTTCLREFGINERVVGDLLGHTPNTVTNKYGTTTLLALRDAVEAIY